MADKKLNSLTFPNLPDRYILDAGHVKYSDSDTYAGGTVGKALQEKSAGIENLVTASSIQTLENKVPYLFRQTPNAGHNELDTIVGGTVAWNQILPNGNFADTTHWNVTNGTRTVADNVMTFTASAKDGFVTNGDMANKTVGHVYLFLASVKLTTGTTLVYLSAWSGGQAVKKAYTSNTTALQTLSIMMKYSQASGDVAINDERASGWDAIQVKNVCAFDLTQMFGSTIADYIYSLEQTTAGAGVAYFKSLGFNKPYYPYNAGELMSVSGLQSHDTVGFNQWDEVWERGAYDVDDGSPYDANQIRSKNYIPVLSDTNYYIKSSPYVWMMFFDENKNILTADLPNTSASAGNARGVGDQIFKTPIGCAFIKFYCQASYGTTYNNDICINISDSAKNGTYEPYVKHSYSLDSTLTLRGIPKLDASSNVYYDGDVYEADGKVTRKFGIRTYQSGDESLADAITDGTNTVYKLTTPTTETAESYQYAQACDPNGTEEYVTTGIVPVGHDTKYPITLSDIMPTSNGNYVLKCTVTGGVASYEWVSES